MCVWGGGGCEVVNEFTCETKASCDPAVWRQSPADQCGNSPCDFCCTSHEMMAAGGICPVPLAADANMRSQHSPRFCTLHEFVRSPLRSAKSLSMMLGIITTC